MKSCSFNGSALENPPLSSLTALLTNIDSTLKEFKSCASIDVRSRTANRAVRKCFNCIIEQRNAFVRATEQTVLYLDALGTFASQVLEFYACSTSSRLSGEDATHTLELLHDQAKACECTVPDIMKGYTQICKSLQKIHDDLDVYRCEIKRLQTEKATRERNIESERAKMRRNQHISAMWNAKSLEGLMKLQIAVLLREVPYIRRIIDILMIPERVQAYRGAARAAFYRAQVRTNCMNIELEKRQISHLENRINGASEVIDSMSVSLRSSLRHLSQCYRFWDQRLREPDRTFEEMRFRSGPKPNGVDWYQVKRWSDIKDECYRYALEIRRILDRNVVYRKVRPTMNEYQ